MEPSPLLRWSQFRIRFSPPAVMGIVNVTPDSFADGGRYLHPRRAVDHALRLVEEGADLLDIGGESTRPSAPPVSSDEELRRILPVITGLVKRRVRVPLSVDTSKARVAEEALAAGAAMVNDIYGLRGDPALRDVVARHRVPVVIMHMKGTPQTMQRHPAYRDLLGEVRRFFREGIQLATDAGIDRRKIILDPGIGFGKTVQHNLRLLQALGRFVDLGCPLLVGVSRKSFIGKILDLPVERRLIGTCAAVAVAVYNGAHLVRVHDVKEAVQVVRFVHALTRCSSG